jgi:hypothetical protein
MVEKGADDDVNDEGDDDGADGTTDGGDDDVDNDDVTNELLCLIVDRQSITEATHPTDEILDIIDEPLNMPTAKIKDHEIAGVLEG